MEFQKSVLITKKVRGEDFHSLEPDYLIFEPKETNAEFKREELDEILPKVTAIVAITDVSAEMIAKALSLKVIVANGAGFDNIDITAATALRIPVINVPDATAYSTAELAMALILDVSRRISELDRLLRRNADNVADFFSIGKNPGQNLAGKTLGIIGLGHIGMTLAEMCWPFRLNIQYYNRHRLPLSQEKGIRFVSFEELLETSDIISIHCPLNNSTRNMINYEAFSRMKQGAIFINTARGPIADYDALTYFLENGKLKGAGLDVYPAEPEIPAKLFKLENVVLTPHIGTNTVETRQGMADAICDVIRTVCEAEPGQIFKNVINREIYRREPVTSQPDESSEIHPEKESES